MKLVLVMCLALCRVSNSQSQIYPAQSINPDAIYFDDNRPQLSQLPNNGINGINVEGAPTKFGTTSNTGQSTFSILDNLPVTSTSRTPNGDENVHLNGASRVLTSFSLNLMKFINVYTRGNSVASPYSVATLLSLLQQGATGAGLAEISNTLLMNKDISVETFRGYIRDLQSRNSRNILRSANNLFLANGFILNQDFRNIAQRDFRCDLTPTSFLSPIQAARDINGWVAKRTDDKISNIVSPDSLDINTQLVLVNAVYFKGIWEVPFRRQATMPGLFRVTQGPDVKVEYMKTRRHFKCGKDEMTDSRIILLPFENNEYSLMIILPSSLTNVRDAMSLLTVTQLEAYTNFEMKEVMLEMPKFSVKSDADLIPILKQLGISKIFQQQSDLTNIGTFQSLNPQVTSATHSAVLSIDEEGGTAAAATAFGAVALSNNEPNMVFQVNRPFIAILWDMKAKIPIFLATIENPAEA